MCGRAMLTVSADDLEQTFGFPAPAGYRPRYNIAPSQRLLCVVGGEQGVGFRELVWGLVPFWAKDETIGRRLINARSETIGEKPAFRAAFAKRRCLVVVDGFYEWQRTVGGKRPHRIHAEGGQPFTLGGVWERWDRGPDAVESCAVVTTSANELMSPIHDRMPVIVAPEDRMSWLAGDTDTSELGRMMRPYEGSDLEAYEVSTVVNSPANDTPECLEPVASSSGELF